MAASSTKTITNKKSPDKTPGIFAIIFGILAFPGTITFAPGVICVGIGLTLSVWSIFKHHKVLGIVGLAINMGAIGALIYSATFWSNFSKG